MLTQIFSGLPEGQRCFQPRLPSDSLPYSALAAFQRPTFGSRGQSRPAFDNNPDTDCLAYDTH